jgi:hypothetical protein
MHSRKIFVNENLGVIFSNLTIIIIVAIIYPFGFLVLLFCADAQTLEARASVSNHVYFIISLLSKNVRREN